MSAKDEKGGDVPVTVQDVGGLNMQEPQVAYPDSYLITYAATHPVTGDVFTEARELYITPDMGAIMPMVANVGNEAALRAAVKAAAKLM